MQQHTSPPTPPASPREISLVGLVMAFGLVTVLLCSGLSLARRHLDDMRSLALMANQEQVQQVHLLGTIQETLVQLSRQLDRPVSLSIPDALPGQPLGSGVCAPRDAGFKENLSD
jgi:hypothetical protein